jgi:MFS family permease
VQTGENTSFKSSSVSGQKKFSTIPSGQCTAAASIALCASEVFAKDKRDPAIMLFSPTPWLVAGIAFVVLGISRGIHTSFGVFNVALLDTFGWSRGATAGIFSIVLTIDALLSPVVGYLLDRYGTKRIAMGGCVALVVGLLVSSQVTALWQLYISFGLILAIGFTCRHGAAHL